MMLELAFTVCLVASPDSCEDRSLLYIDVSQVECAMGAQSVLAPWSLENPGWQIDSYRCRYLDTRVTEL
jgi:hypothetical protein